MPWFSDADEPRTTDDALIVIAEHDFQQSLQDPRVHELFARGEALLAELDAEHAGF